MKIKTGFMMREVAGKFVAVPVGVGAMILKECCKPIKREHYQMTEGQAEKDVETFTSQLIEAGILEA